MDLFEKTPFPKDAFFGTRNPGTSSFIIVLLVLLLRRELLINTCSVRHDPPLKTEPLLLRQEIGDDSLAGLWAHPLKHLSLVAPPNSDPHPQPREPCETSQP